MLKITFKMVKGGSRLCFPQQIHGLARSLELRCITNQLMKQNCLREETSRLWLCMITCHSWKLEDTLDSLGILQYMKFYGKIFLDRENRNGLLPKLAFEAPIHKDEKI